MRPIETDASKTSYSKDAQLNREVFELRDSGAEPPTKRRRIETEKATVGSKIIELEKLLTTHWIPTQTWDPDASRQEAERLYTIIGTGYTAATRSLINQTGQYCSFCDAPLFSGLQAEPILPADWFPRHAFCYDQQLLTCGPCRSAKHENLSRSNGSAEALQNPNALAWPQLFAQSLANNALLPFRYELLAHQQVPGELSSGHPLGKAESEWVLDLYRRGRVQAKLCKVSGLTGVQVEPPGSSAFWISTWLIAAATGRPIEVGVKHAIGVMGLNSIDRQQARGWLDRRLELRTMAHLTALDLCGRAHLALANSDNDLHKGVVELWRAAVKSTGFWGVWLSVYRDFPGIQQVLAEIMPGTAPRLWAL